MVKILRFFALLICIFSEVAPNSLKNNLSIEEKNDNFPVPPHCGVSKISKATNRIHGGVVVEPHELPWMVFFSMGCGGTFLNSRWVLTAAHCFYARNATEKKIIDNARAFISAQDCGMKKNVKDYYCDSNATEVEIGKYILHEKYNYDRHYNDIALVQLKDAVQFTDKIQPICLPYNNQAGGSSLFDKEAHVSGWGRNETYEIGLHLLKVVLKVWNASRCEAGGRTSEQNICAGGVVGKGPCQGDSGGPLYMHLPTVAGSNKNEPFYQIGVDSRAPLGPTGPCAQDGLPSIFTNVTTYIPWIRSTILSNE